MYHPAMVYHSPLEFSKPEISFLYRRSVFWTRVLFPVHGVQFSEHSFRFLYIHIHILPTPTCMYMYHPSTSTCIYHPTTHTHTSQLFSWAHTSITHPFCQPSYTYMFCFLNLGDLDLSFLNLSSVFWIRVQKTVISENWALSSVFWI